VSIYLNKPHVINKRVTTVRFATSLPRSDRHLCSAGRRLDRRTLIAKNARIYHDQDEYVLSDDRSFEFRPVEQRCERKSAGVQLVFYRFELLNEEKRIRLTVSESERSKEVIWLEEILFSRLVKWCGSEIGNSTTINTLKLLSIEEYQREYERLKNKYGKDLTDRWCESTDPQKHVFEDLGQ
jgi:hypothetical protein